MWRLSSSSRRQQPPGTLKGMPVVVVGSKLENYVHGGDVEANKLLKMKCTVSQVFENQVQELVDGDLVTKFVQVVMEDGAEKTLYAENYYRKLCGRAKGG